MPNSLYDQHTREHPAYRRGFQTGQAVGLRISLGEICGEVARQDDAAIVARSDPHTQDGRTHEAASTALLKVENVVAGRFRQEAT